MTPVTAADSTGIASFDGLVRGSYLIEVSTKELDVLGWPRQRVRVDIGGGNIDKLEIPLENNIIRFSNRDGIKGGAKLWALEDRYHITTNHPATNS